MESTTRLSIPQAQGNTLDESSEQNKNVKIEANGLLPSDPPNEEDIHYVPPPRRNPSLQPKRGILKRSPAPTRFNFRRDIIQPLNYRLTNSNDATSNAISVVENAWAGWRGALNRWSVPAVPPRGTDNSHVDIVNATGELDSKPVTPTVTVTPNPPPLSINPLKSVRFTISNLTIVYPINATGQLPPLEESNTKGRVEEEFRLALEKRASSHWNGIELLKLYNECCRTREEMGLELVKNTFAESANSAPRTLDLSNQPLSVGAAETLGDVLSVEFGLRRLVLENCSLEDESLKPILHALLVSASLPNLSLANNKKIKSKGWKLIAVFLCKARALKFLDVSSNNLDRRAIELMVQALTIPLTAHVLSAETKKFNDPELIEPNLSTLRPMAPLLREESHQTEPAKLASIRMDGCSLKNQSLEALAHCIRTSSVKHISLRRNKISSLGAVALAIMIRDYPVATDVDHSHPSSSVTNEDSRPSTPTLLSSSLLNGNGYAHDAPMSNTVTAREILKTLPPPPIHPKRSESLKVPPKISVENDFSADEDESFGAERKTYIERNSNAVKESQHSQISSGYELWREKLRKEIEGLPRVGSLMTLDVKGNEIRGGVVYIAQVLKRNRTLRILNLSENKIDVQGLAAIAEALKYNTTLETLDLSHNPCCGPGLEGINTLRAAFSHENNLMRVFLNDTDLSSEGAIALAEFLPDINNLIHLDLTENLEIDIAGVMALAVAIKLNRSIRCLDLNIPANEPDFARLSQDILQSCIRNTEYAQAESAARGLKQPVPALILKSTVARNLENARQGPQAEAQRRLEKLLNSVRDCSDLLERLLVPSNQQSRDTLTLRDVLHKGKDLQFQLLEASSIAERSEAYSDEINLVTQRLNNLCQRAETIVNGSTARNRISLEISSTLLSPTRQDSSDEPDSMPSPSFSITDSDDSDFESPTPQSTSSPTPKSKLDADPLGIITADLSALVNDVPSSPVDQASRNLTLEEGEVFRRKHILESQSDELDDESKTGDDLRKEILEADIVEEERSPRIIPASPPNSPRKAGDSLVLSDD